MRKIVLLVMAFAMTLPISAQLLYRISGNGLTHDSFIVGTYHLADSSYVDSIAGAKQILEAVDQVCGELNILDTPVESMQKMTNLGLLPDSIKLKDLFTDEEFERIDEGYKQFTGIPITHPNVYPTFSRLMPYSIVSKITNGLCAQLERRFIDPSKSIDIYFQLRAAEMGKPIIGLETIDFQMDFLFGAPLEQQAQQLIYLLEHLDEGKKQVAAMIHTYYAQDIDELQKIFIGSPEAAEGAEYLVYKRNANWIKLMPAIMQDKSTLFAVGAGHLGGEKGVISLLRNEGYTVVGVK